MSADFDKIVTDYQDKVYNTCLGFLKNEEDAEDTAQEVFIQLFRSIGTFKGESEIGTWIYRIAVNKSLELIRRNSRKKRSGATSDLNDQIPASGMFYHPGVTLENKERAAILFSAIDALPEAQKTAFLLAKTEELSYEEIAKVMDKTVSSVESLLHRAKDNLRKELKTYYAYEKE